MFDNKMFNDEGLLKRTIDTLMITQAKDRLLLFSLAEIVMGYIRDPELEKNYLEDQNNILAAIADRFNIRSDDDLDRCIKWVSEYLKNAELAVMDPLPGQH